MSPIAGARARALPASLGAARIRTGIGAARSLASIGDNFATASPAYRIGFSERKAKAADPAAAGSGTPEATAV